MKNIYITPEMEIYTEVDEDVISTSPLVDTETGALTDGDNVTTESKSINFADDIDW